jgi:hypothetical protein
MDYQCFALGIVHFLWSIFLSLHSSDAWENEPKSLSASGWKGHPAEQRENFQFFEMKKLKPFIKS